VNQIGHNLTLLIEGMTALAGGDFFGTEISAVSTPIVLAGSLVICASALVIAEMRRRARSALSRGPSGESLAPEQFAYFSFWTCCLVVAVVAFVGTSAPVDVSDARYLLGAYVAVGALLPALALRTRVSRLSVTVALSLFAFSAAYELQRHPVEMTSAPDAGAANALAVFARAQGVTYGYASYWDALDLTWASKLRFQAYPAENCTPGQPRLCRGGIGEISSWYSPRPGTRSLLIVDRAVAGLTVVDTTLGKPVAATTISGMNVYVYPYDIASKLH
jgi:hypothetical protein